MKISRKSKVKTEIPTASLPDIVFMLLLFFMVTTVFQQYSGIPVNLPEAKKIKKLEAKKNVTSLYANQTGEIMIDDKFVDLNRIRHIMYEKRVENPKLIVSLKVDRFSDMTLLTDIHEELREADALKVNYCAKYGQ
ncbi:MAG: biopolymer transporter ExbD [bacterium]